MDVTVQFLVGGSHEVADDIFIAAKPWIMCLHRRPSQRNRLSQRRSDVERRWAVMGPGFGVG